MSNKKESVLIGYPNIISYEYTPKIIEQMGSYICKVKMAKNKEQDSFAKYPSLIKTIYYPYLLQIIMY
jgi:hypothetical protein